MPPDGLRGGRLRIWRILIYRYRSRVGQSRTALSGQRILSPLPVQSAQTLTNRGSSVASTATKEAHLDPDLAILIDAWPSLPDAVKAGIVAMAKASRAHVTKEGE